MNIFERLYNKVFHNKDLKGEERLSNEMVNELAEIDNDEDLSNFGKSLRMVDRLEFCLGKIVKNRKKLRTYRNKVSNFLESIKDKKTINDKIAYLSSIDKDKKFGSSYRWVRKIGPIFSKLKSKLGDNVAVKSENASMMDAFVWLEHLGLIRKSSDFDLLVAGFNTARGVILKYGDEKLMKNYGKVILENIDSYVLYLFCLICKSLESFLKGRDRQVINCIKIRNSKKVGEDMSELMREIKYFQGKRRNMLSAICLAEKGDFNVDDHNDLDLLSMSYGFYSQGSKKMKKIVEESWKEVASGI